MRFAIVRALFNDAITARLLEGALHGFAAARVPKRNITVVEVPGSFELPLAALWLSRTRRYDAVICLGCVIRGETAHFEYIAGEAARGIQDVALETGIPVIFGVLTTETLAQADDRSADVAAGPGEHTKSQASGNKGYEAAQSALHMAILRKKLAKS